MSILFKEYTDEEFKELFYSDGLEVGREEGAAEQRAKDEIELQTMRNEVSLLKAELERLKQKMTELHS